MVMASQRRRTKSNGGAKRMGNKNNNNNNNNRISVSVLGFILVLALTFTFTLQFTSAFHFHSNSIPNTFTYTNHGAGCAMSSSTLRASISSPSTDNMEGGIESKSSSSAVSVGVGVSDDTAYAQHVPVTSSYSGTPSQSLSIDEMNPILRFQKKDNGKEKVLNLTGLFHLAAIVSTMPFWLAAMEILHVLGDNDEAFDPNRAKFDYSGKIWCRIYLWMTDCYPEIAGDVSRLEQKQTQTDSDSDTNNGACFFVANHASFLDIAVLCCVLDPVFKFIAKDSLKKFPGVGRQLVGGEHILIDRTNKRSQLQSFKQAITYLKNGVPIMAFPEGARSPDGKLMPFKKGIFSMAIKAKVPIVPLSLANTHAVMPNEGFLPVQSGRDKLRVYVHEAIDVEGKSEEEIVREVREALLSELPMDQHPDISTA